ncbi:MAG: hypothetical protein WCL44_11405 [bacterium]
MKRADDMWNGVMVLSACLVAATLPVGVVAQSVPVAGVLDPQALADKIARVEVQHLLPDSGPVGLSPDGKGGVKFQIRAYDDQGQEMRLTKEQVNNLFESQSSNEEVLRDNCGNTWREEGGRIIWEGRTTDKTGEAELRVQLLEKYATPTHNLAVSSDTVSVAVNYYHFSAKRILPQAGKHRWESKYKNVKGSQTGESGRPSVKQRVTDYQKNHPYITAAAGITVGVAVGAAVIAATGGGDSGSSSTSAGGNGNYVVYSGTMHLEMHVTGSVPGLDRPMDKTVTLSVPGFTLCVGPDGKIYMPGASVSQNGGSFTITLAGSGGAPMILQGTISGDTMSGTISCNYSEGGISCVYSGTFDLGKSSEGPGAPSLPIPTLPSPTT